jgi:receptor expression-enhancing protein 5/6
MIMDEQQWLTYWVVMGAFTCTEYFSDKLLFWFPFYYSAKLPFILYLQSPQTRGAEVLYNRMIAPFLTHHEQRIDDALSNARQRASGTFVCFFHQYFL